MSRIKPVTWNGVVYPSAKHCAEAIDQNPATLRGWLRKGYTCDADRLKRKRKKSKFRFMGQPYRTQTELHILMRKHIGLTEPPKKKRKPTSGSSKPVTWNGVYYPSITECARQLNKPFSLMRQRIRNGYTCDDDMKYSKA